MTDILWQDQGAAMNRIDDLQATVTRLMAENKRLEAMRCSHWDSAENSFRDEKQKRERAEADLATVKAELRRVKNDDAEEYKRLEVDIDTLRAENASLRQELRQVQEERNMNTFVLGLIIGWLQGAAVGWFAAKSGWS